MRVTVTETIEHSADITAEMVEAYLARHGWDRTGNGWSKGYRAVGWPGGRRDAFAVRLVIRAIAALEDRVPDEVLADIASGR